MQPVLDSEPAVAGVELEVVEVMELRGEGEREVVSGVVIHHLQQGLYRIQDCHKPVKPYYSNTAI